MQEDVQNQTSLYGGALILAARSANEELPEHTHNEPSVLNPEQESREYYIRHYKRYRYWYEKTKKDIVRERSIQ